MAERSQRKPRAQQEPRCTCRGRLLARRAQRVRLELTKLRTSDMDPVQTIDPCYHPIGIAYDKPTSRAWVDCYTGTIRVYDDR